MPGTITSAEVRCSTQWGCRPASLPPSAYMSVRISETSHYVGVPSTPSRRFASTAVPMSFFILLRIPECNVVLHRRALPESRTPRIPLAGGSTVAVQATVSASEPGDRQRFWLNASSDLVSVGSPPAPGGVPGHAGTFCRRGRGLAPASTGAASGRGVRGPQRDGRVAGRGDEGRGPVPPQCGQRRYSWKRRWVRHQQDDLNKLHAIPK